MSAPGVAIAGIVLTCVVLFVSHGTAHAHQSSFTYASLNASDDRTRIEYEVRLSSFDLFEALELGEDRDATDEEIQGGAEALRAYVFERVRIVAPGAKCETVPGPVTIVREGQRFAQVRSLLRCPRAIDEVNVLYDLFFDLDAQHEGLLRVGDGVVLFTAASRNYHHVLGAAAPASQFGFLTSGAKHVLYGLDHILFLLSLMMVMGLRLESASLRQRSAGETARNAALVATAFTVGHSITLIVAALGWIWIPSRIVESLIAASIVYVAAENILRPDPPGRHILTFGFGLVHGMGFASMLRPLLPPEDLVVPLLVFNVGVEAGQIVVLLAAIPILSVLMHQIGVAAYRRVVLPASSLVLAAAGLVWLVERAFVL